MKGLLAALLLSLTLIRGAAAQNRPLSGTYGWLVNVFDVDSGGGNGAAVLGTMNFDGAGNLTGTYTFQSRGAGGGPAGNASGALTGTYSTNSDGTGSLTANLDIGFSLPISFVISEGGQALQLLSSTNLGDGGDTSLQGNSQSLAGALPIAPFVDRATATGSVALTLSGASTSTAMANTTVYTATNATGSGNVQCSDGSMGSWNAFVPSVSVILNPDVVSGASGNGGLVAGSYLVGVSSNYCGRQNFTTLSGLATGNASGSGAVSVVLHNGGSIVNGIARAGQTGSLNGSYGFHFNYSPFPAGTIGVLTFDGAGNVTESFTSSGASGSSPSGTLSGSYSTGSNGSGTMSLSGPNGANVTYSFVITDNGSGILALQTDKDDTGADLVFGAGRLQ